MPCHACRLLLSGLKSCHISTALKTLKNIYQTNNRAHINKLIIFLCRRVMSGSINILLLVPSTIYCNSETQ